MACWTMSTACLGEGGVVYKGSVTSGATAGHSFDSTLNPGKLPTVAGAKINIRVVDDVSECGVGSSIEGTTDSTGTYNVEATFAGAGEMRVTLCFTKTGYAPYRYVGEFPGGEDPTQGQLYLNVVLAPE